MKWSGSLGRCPCPNSDKGFDWNTGYQTLINFHRAGPRWDVDQLFWELQKRGPASEAAQSDLCLCDSLYISRLILTVNFWMIARPAVAVLDI